MSNLEHVMTEKEMKDIWERLTAGESSIKSAHKRIDNLEKCNRCYTKDNRTYNVEQQMHEGCSLRIFLCAHTR